VGAVDLVKIFLSSSLISVQNLVAVRRTMWWAHVRCQNLACWSPTPLGQR